MEYTTANILHHSQYSNPNAKIVEIVKIFNLFICN